MSCLIESYNETSYGIEINFSYKIENGNMVNVGKETTTRQRAEATSGSFLHNEKSHIRSFRWALFKGVYQFIENRRNNNLLNI